LKIQKGNQNPYIEKKKDKGTKKKINRPLQPRETGNIEYTRHRKTKKKHSTLCVGHHYAETNTTNVHHNTEHRTQTHNRTTQKTKI